MSERSVVTATPVTTLSTVSIISRVCTGEGSILTYHVQVMVGLWTRVSVAYSAGDILICWPHESTLCYIDGVQVQNPMCIAWPSGRAGSRIFEPEICPAVIYCNKRQFMGNFGKYLSLGKRF